MKKSLIYPNDCTALFTCFYYIATRHSSNFKSLSMKTRRVFLVCSPNLCFCYIYTQRFRFVSSKLRSTSILIKIHIVKCKPLYSKGCIIHKSSNKTFKSSMEICIISLTSHISHLRQIKEIINITIE